MDPTARTSQHAAGIKWPTMVLVAVALLVVVRALLSHDAIQSLFGPTSVRLVEAYSANASGPTFDHSTFDDLLKKHVSGDGWVDYDGHQKDSVRLDAYIAGIAKAPFDALDRNEKLALLINAYNAFTLRLILDYYPVDSIKGIPAAKRWAHKRWQVGTQTWSLDQIEHEQIRPKFHEPRVHFALVCAAVGCPKLRNEVYRAEWLEEQLDDQTQYANTHERWFRFDPDKGIVHLTKLYKWYGGDFEQVAGTVLDYAARYSPQLKQALDAERKPNIRWLNYDWSLNSKENAK